MAALAVFGLGLFVGLTAGLFVSILVGAAICRADRRQAALGEPMQYERRDAA